MEAIIKKFRLFISVALIVGATLTYLGIYIPMRIELETVITENLMLAAKAKERSLEQYIRRSIENTISLSIRANMKEKLLHYKSGRSSLQELKEYGTPLYLESVRGFSNIEKAYRIVDNQVISAYGEPAFQYTFKVDQVTSVFFELVEVQSVPMLLVYVPISSDEKILAHDLAFFDMSEVLKEVSEGNILFKIIDGKDIHSLNEATKNSFIHEKQRLIRERNYTGYLLPIEGTSQYIYLYMENATLFEPIQSISNRVLIGFIIGIGVLLGLMNYILIKDARNILERTEKSREKYRQYANQDFLTGVSSRLFFERWLEKRKQGKMPSLMPLAVIMIDLNRFKYINDNYGHQAGDHALQYVAGVLCSFLEKEDLVVRYGGDEFLMVLSHCEYEVASKIIQKIDHQIETAKKFTFPVSISYGIEQVNDLAMMQQCIDRADEKMYAYKKQKRSKE
jgi:diguanylate cyclase (GGDEF)-like protein